MKAPRDLLVEVGARFTRDISEHQLTVLHDDGLYRHLRFRRPASSTYWFDLVTWPGHLSITGDMEAYTFARVEDMFTFFRVESGWNSGRINPQYWAEKLVARSKVTEYSEELLRQLIDEYVTEVEADWPGLRQAVQDEVLDDYGFVDETSAMALLNQFEHVACDAEGKQTGVFRFEDTYDWRVREYGHHYLWCCNAIQWGIEQYDRRPATAPMPKLVDTDGMEWTWHQSGYLREDDGETLTAEQVKADFEAVEIQPAAVAS